MAKVRKLKEIKTHYSHSIPLDEAGEPIYGYKKDGTPRKRAAKTPEEMVAMRARKAALEKEGLIEKRTSRKIENLVKGFTRADQEQIFYMFKLVLVQGSLNAGLETLEEMRNAKRKTPFGLVFQVLMEALTSTNPKDRFHILMEIIYLCVGKPTVRAEIMNEGSPLLAIQNNYLAKLPEELQTQLATAMQDDMERRGKTKEDYKDFPIVKQIIDGAK